MLQDSCTCSKHHEPEATPATPVSTKPVVVRGYQPQDLPAIVELFTSGMLSYADQENQDKKIWLDYVQQSVDSDLATIDEVYFAPGGHFWVATVQDQDGNEVVVGMVGLERKPGNQGEIRRMSVKTEYRRYGVGRLLVSHLEQYAKHQGLTKIWLSTGGPMVQAQRFYKSMGYVHTTTKVFATVEILFFEKQIISGDP